MILSFESFVFWIFSWACIIGSFELRIYAMLFDFLFTNILWNSSCFYDLNVALLAVESLRLARIRLRHHF